MKPNRDNGEALWSPLKFITWRRNDVIDFCLKYRDSICDSSRTGSCKISFPARCGRPTRASSLANVMNWVGLVVTIGRRNNNTPNRRQERGWTALFFSSCWPSWADAACHGQLPVVWLSRACIQGWREVEAHTSRTGNLQWYLSIVITARTLAMPSRKYKNAATSTAVTQPQEVTNNIPVHCINSILFPRGHARMQAHQLQAPTIWLPRGCRVL